MPNDTPKNNEAKVLTESLYKQNAELAIRNKTFALLGKLYDISILTLEPKDLAARICQVLQVDLSLELVGVMLLEPATSQLVSLAFCSSDRLNQIQKKYKTFFNDVPLTVTSNPIIQRVINSKSQGYTENSTEIWGSLIPEKMLAEVNTESHVKSSIIFPLIIQQEIIGILIFSLNRQYKDLVEHEKDSLRTFINVIAVALDKAMLYEKVTLANKQLKVLDQARADFISIASHQLRTPPATIKWYLAAVIAGSFGKVTGKLKTALEKTQVTNNSLISLIDDMLNASRIERGKMEFLFQPTDLTQLINTTIDQLTPQAKIKKLKLTYKKPKTKLPEIVADKEKLRQVINNFIDNAIKYTPKGSVTVEAKQIKNEILVSVTDTGKGISAEEKSALFDKYGRGKESIKHAAGLGLGLYIAKVIIDQHKGKVWVESKGLGKGSSFIVSLPIRNGLTTSSFDFAKFEKFDKRAPL